MNITKLIASALLMLFCTSVHAETITEDFESVSIVDANGNPVSGYSYGNGLSNGWKVVGGNIYASAGTADYGLWSKAYSGSKSLEASSSATNNAIVVIPAQLSGTVKFYARKTSTSSSTKGYVDFYDVEVNGDTYKKKSSSSFKYFTLTSTTWTEYTVDLGSEPRLIAICLSRAAIDDVIYSTAEAPHETHNYATTWSNDETGHWHACTAEGYCDAPKKDFAEHDGVICSVCGYKVPGVDTFPWTENFNGITSGIPEGWDNSEGTTTIESYKWNSVAGGHEGRCVKFDSYNNNSGKTNILATPYIYMPENDVYNLKFWCKNSKGGAFTIKVGEYGSAERTTVLDNLTNIASWTEQSVNLSAYAGKVIKVYFCGTSNYGSGDAYLNLDDVTIEKFISHTHDYADTWSKDNSGHWHACLSEVGECDAPKADFAAHTYNEDDICTVCGFEKCYEIDFTESNIPVEWDNIGWKKEGDHLSSGNYNTNILTTSYLKAKKDDVMDIEAYLRYTDEPLTMEYSTDMGETWIQVFSVVADADHYSGGEIKALSFTAPSDGEYQLRFWGQYAGLKSLKGFKDAYKKDLKQSTLSILAANEWGTLCYPASVEKPEGVTAYTATVIENDVIELSEVEGDIPANIPVLLSTTANATLTLPATKHVTSLATSVAMDGNLLVGCTGTIILNGANQYVLQKQNDEVAFYRVNPEKPITTAAYRCYLETPSTAGAKIGFSFGEATSISNVKTSRLNQIYDLNGHKVEKMQKGVIYIINNHKVIVK